MSVSKAVAFMTNETCHHRSAKAHDVAIQGTRTAGHWNRTNTSCCRFCTAHLPDERAVLKPIQQHMPLKHRLAFEL